jgi:hypothetical protein
MGVEGCSSGACTTLKPSTDVVVNDVFLSELKHSVTLELPGAVAYPPCQENDIELPY